MVSTADLQVLIRARDEASKVIDGVQKRTMSAGEAFRTASKGAVIVGAAGTAAFVAMGKSAMTFDQNMREVNSLIGLTEEGFGELKKETLALSSAIGIDANQAVGALYQAISAGVPHENVFAFMEVAGKAAVGGVTDVETAVDGLTTVVNAFGLEASDAERVADVMFMTVKNGKTTFEELSSSMFIVAPIASSLGISFEEVSAMVATLTKQGVPTSVAMTQIRSAMVALSKPSGDMADALYAMGFNSGEAALQALGLQGTLEGVRAVSDSTQAPLKFLERGLKDLGYESTEAGIKALGLEGAMRAVHEAAGISDDPILFATGKLQNMGYASLDAAYASMGLEDTFGELTSATMLLGAPLAKIFGRVEAVGAVLGTTAENSGVFADDFEAAMNSSGAATEAFELVNVGAGRQVELNMIRMKNLAIALGTELLPAVVEITKAINAVLVPVTAWVAKNPELTSTIVKVGAALSAFLLVAGTMGLALGPLITTLQTTGLVFAALAAPVGAIILVLGLAAAAIIYLWKTNEDFRDAVISIWERIQDGISRPIEAISGIWERWGVDIVALASVMWVRVQDVTAEGLEGVRKIVAIGAAEVSDTWDRWGDTMIHIAEAVFRALLGPINLIILLINGIWIVIRDLWENNEQFRDAVIAIWERIKVHLAEAMERIKEAIETGVEFIHGLWERFGDDILRIAAAAWERARTAVAEAIDRIQTVITTAVDIITELWDRFGGQIIEGAERAWELVSSVISGVMDTTRDVVSSVTDRISSIWGKWGSDIEKDTEDRWTGVQGIIATVMEQTRRGVDEATGFMADLWDRWGDEITRITQQVAEIFQTVIPPALEFLGDVIRSTAQFIGDLWAVWGTDITRIASQVWELVGILVDRGMAIMQFLIENTVRIVTALWDEFGDDIIRLATLAWDVLTDITAVAWELIKDVIEGVLRVISGILEVALGILTLDWARAWEGIRMIFDGISLLIVGIANAMIDLLKIAFEGLRDFFGIIWDAISGIFSDAWNGIRRTLLRGVNLVDDSIRRAFNGIRDYFSGFWDTLKGIFTGAWDGLMGILFPEPTILTRIAEAWSPITAVFTGIFTNVKNAIKSAVDGIGDILNGGIGAIEGLLNAVAKAVNAMPRLKVPDIKGLPGRGEELGLPRMPESISLPRIPLMDTGGLVKGPGLFAVGEGVKEIVRTPQDYSQTLWGLGGASMTPEKFLSQMRETFEGMFEFAAAGNKGAAYRTMANDMRFALEQIVGGPLTQEMLPALHRAIALAGETFDGMEELIAQGRKADAYKMMEFDLRNIVNDLQAAARKPAASSSIPAFEFVDLATVVRESVHAQMASSNAGSGSGVNINFYGPIYGMDDFDRRAVEAVKLARFRGAEV